MAASGKDRAGYDKVPKDKGIDSKGIPETKQMSGVPGAPNRGTPKWLKAAANAAESKAISREFGSSHTSGTGSVRTGMMRESIHGGQATRRGKDSD